MALRRGLPVGTVVRCILEDQMYFETFRDYRNVEVGTVGFIRNIHNASGYDGDYDIEIVNYGLAPKFEPNDSRWEVINETDF